MTNLLIKSRIVTSAEDADFLCKLSPLVCAEEFTVSSAEHRTGASLLEVEMKVCSKCKIEKSLKEFRKYCNRGKYFYRSSWCKNCHKEKVLSYPTAFLLRIKARCLYDKNSSYYKRGIKNFLNNNCGEIK